MSGIPTAPPVTTTATPPVTQMTQPAATARHAVPAAHQTPPAASPTPAASSPTQAASAAEGTPASESARSPQSAWAISAYLATLVRNGGSDLHLKAGAPPMVRVRGQLLRADVPPLAPADVEQVILESMNAETREKYLRSNEADYAIYIPEIGRFRVNAFRARGNAALVARHVAGKPVPLAELGVPEVLQGLSLHHRGLVLVTGPTGSGKTTTLSGMIDLINENRHCHVLTLEDPIEIMHVDKAASVNQREMGSDTADFKAAMKAAMRQDPDVILIGEMRDPETVHAAVSAAQTGHFVMSTLHTTNAKETINRVIDFFEPHEQKQIRIALAQSLQGIVCQRLVPKADGTGRVCVMEIMIMTEQIREAIIDPEKTDEITDMVAKGHYYGMQTFDQHLVALVKENLVSIPEAKSAATDPHDLSIMLKRAGIAPDLVDA